MTTCFAKFVMRLVSMQITALHLCMERGCLAAALLWAVLLARGVVAPSAEEVWRRLSFPRQQKACAVNESHWRGNGALAPHHLCIADSGARAEKLHAASTPSSMATAQRLFPSHLPRHVRGRNWHPDPGGGPR